MKKTIRLNKTWTYDTSAILGSPGGFGTVYRGLSEDGTNIAVKVMRESTEDLGRRELGFARYAMGKSGKNVVSILDCGRSVDGCVCIVMELAKYTLRDVMSKKLKEGQSNTEAEVIELLSDACKGLLEAGDWIHRDIKPENILRVDESWKIADFGIARPIAGPTSIHTMKMALSPHYASPEQWEGRTATKRTDVYALGCIAFEMLSGNKAFDGSMEVLQGEHRIKVPILSAGSPQIRMLILRMLAKPEVARPFPQEVIAALQSVEMANKALTPSAGRLAEVAVRISDQAAREEAEKAREEADTSERRELQKGAHAMLEAIFTELFSRAANIASRAMPVPHHDGRSRIYHFELGGGVLEATLGEYREVGRKVFKNARTDVICADRISISTKKYRRSSSLYFMDRGKGHEWCEVAFYNVVPSMTSQPCFLPPTSDAVLALSAGVHTWNVAYGPKNFSDAGFNNFLERWLGFLADAADGNLRYPSFLPEAQSRTG